MNSLFVILIILIILSLLYLYYRNNQYNKILESFDNPTQSSLSTYFHSTVDSDHKNKRNIYNKRVVGTDKGKLWNGVWANDILYMYAQIIVLNDKLLLGISNSSLEQTLDQLSNSANSDGCHNNSFIGLCQLNGNGEIFRLIKVICNTYQTSSLNLTVNALSGTIKDDKLQLYSNGIAGYIELVKKQNITTKENNFTKNIDRFNTNFPDIPKSTFERSKIYCTDSEPCKVTNMGLGDSFNNMDFNACGTPVSNKNNTCKDTPKCLYYTPAPEGYSTCTPIVSTHDYMSFSTLNRMHRTAKNNYENCDYLNYFGKSGFNSAILCYVTNLGHTQTLNYQFFGVLPGESSLTMQSDVMHDVLNSNAGVLEKTRRIILAVHKKDDSTSTAECAADYGSTTPCCGQENTGEVSAEYVCPRNSPTCSNYVYNVQWGTCGAAPVKLTNNYTKLAGIDNGGDDYKNTNGKYISYGNATVDQCKETCNSYSDCYGFAYNGTCYPKTSLMNYSGTGPKSGVDLYTRNKKGETILFQPSNVQINKALSFSNFLEFTGDIDTVENMQKKSLMKAKKIVKSYKESPTNRRLMPAIWQINYGVEKNYNNSCTFNLSTSALYNTPVKYAEFNNDGTTSLSLYPGGPNQNLIFEGLTVIKSNSNMPKYVVMTANIRANNGSYLIPSIERSGFANNSNIISLEETPKMNGKWIILGFNLKNINQVDSITKIFKMESRMTPIWVYKPSMYNWYTITTDNLVGDWSITKVRDSTRMTISFWLNVTTLNNTDVRNIFHVSNQNLNCCDPGNRIPALWVNSGSALILVMSDTVDGNGSGYGMFAQGQYNVETLITISWNGRTINAYANGQLTQTLTMEADLVQAMPTASFYIGDPWYSSDGGVQIKDFEIYNTVLTPKEITRLYNFATNDENNY